MLNKVLMPAMGATMDQGIIIAWKIKQGQSVQEGQIILDFESDKATYEYESPFAGVVRKILVEEGQIVPVEQLIAIIGDPDDEIPSHWLEGEQGEQS